MDYEYDSEYANAEEPRPTSAFEIVFLVYCLFGILVYILLIYIFLHFKRLFSVVNVYLVNWCIADAMRCLTSPGVYVSFTGIVGSNVSSQYSCFISEIEECFSLVTSIFQILIIIDWWVENFWNSKLTKWRENYNIVIAGVWAPSILSAIITSGICVKDGYYGFAGEIFLLSHLAFLLFLIITFVVKCICKCRKANLNNNNLFYLIFAIELFIESRIFFIVENLVFFVVSEFCYNATAFLLLAFLTIGNSQFRTCLKQVFTCKFSEDDDYTREALTGIYCKRCHETLT